MDVEAGAANQGAVHIWLAHERSDVIRLHAAAIEDVAAFGRFRAKPLAQRRLGAEGNLSLAGVMKRQEDDQQFELGNLPSPALPEK